MKSVKKQDKLSPATTAMLKRLFGIWRWSGNPFQWAGWLVKQGMQEEAIAHLAMRISMNKIKNPFSLQEVAHCISQNVAERKHAAASKQKELPRDKAPELLSSVFKRAGM